MIERSQSEPAGWFIELHRASGSSTLRWGPFDSHRDAEAWVREHRIPTCLIIPLYKTVDWSR